MNTWNIPIFIYFFSTRSFCPPMTAGIARVLIENVAQSNQQKENS